MLEQDNILALFYFKLTNNVLVMESQSHMQDLGYKISHTVLKTKKLKKIKNVFLYKDINIMKVPLGRTIPSVNPQK